MAEEIVSQDDLPDNLVPADDLPGNNAPDKRDVLSPLIGAGAGAIGGGLAHPVMQSGLNKMTGAAPGTISVPHPDDLPEPKRTKFNPRGRSVEQSVENWRNYNQAQLEEAKKVRQESKLHKKYPGFSRMGAPIPELPANATTAQKIGAKVWPGATTDIKNFVQGMGEYKLPVIGRIGPLASHLLGGAAAGIQGVDAYNRSQQGDTPGAWISGIGSAGTGVSTLPFPPPIRAAGAGVGLSAEAINAYRDAMRKGQIVHGAPEAPENVDPMGNAFAAGGLAQAFDPEGSDYDYQTATSHGMGPTGTGENTGHWGSVAPAPAAARQQYNLPEDSYVVLKGKSHPTFNKAEAAENARGSKIIKLGDRYYSIPNK